MEEEEKKLRALDPILCFNEEDIKEEEYLNKPYLQVNDSFITPFYELITQSVQPPYAISIDGLWGTGKTTLMKILHHKLEKEGYPVFWFNPWEYRKTQNVVLAFLQFISNKNKNFLESLGKGAKRVLLGILDPALNVSCRVVTGGVFAFNDLKSNAFSSADYQDYLKAVKDEFKALIDKISQESGNKPVIIFFDDLDRCLPEDAIEFLEALKNLFINKDCKSIFICGIDTHIAKQFITEHYHGIEDTFSINYFRKIFNLTISMPHRPDIQDLLLKYINILPFTWDGQKAEALARMVFARSLQTHTYSVRKQLNIITNFCVFLKFNPGYDFAPETHDPEDDFIINLLTLKESWYPLYEKLIQESLRQRLADMDRLIKSLVEHEKDLSEEQREFLSHFLGDKSPFLKKKLSKILTNYPTLA